ncbi:hypothetical protein FVF58_04670 [Paraburkholderia panacisoli]|uniref:Uncharacterized protein n=1 Tax=Paraburkholderia panacisoli TaxID=2603818 RepID=A0A5B0HJS1_9BURK|nr:hypothetical protein [Paraburkholderia panacisoli]KAA1015212.1 hypothetical protein FVF58_04670 [Paraburkholderia panacisoli]
MTPFAQVLELARFYHAMPNGAERAPPSACALAEATNARQYPLEKEKPQESYDFLGLNLGGLGRNRTIDTRIFNLSIRPAGIRRDTQRHAKSST